ncbi:purine-nucleoside phosphorylase [Allofustis seminis]|uniref:purine-nucleoside phosphorylase n=1 Tax=Allofustis seminis TaxID=166939 RepID=UPI00035F7C81|nr:purine-nucleoside phosphorylase [Allofustis seminis]
MQEILKRVENAADFIKDQGVEDLEVGLILGSGLGKVAEMIENPLIISYTDIPDFPISTVAGHAGQFVYGTLNGKKVLAQQGRFHYYEGYSMQEITIPVRILKALGAHSVIITNAAGGVNKAFTPGDLMMITDQINYTGDNPLIGRNDDEVGPRFPDMSYAYDVDYQVLMRNIAKDLGIKIQEGVYMGYSGPTYETPAEIRMSRILGADAVGMSTVPEVIVAQHVGLRVAGISCITNMAAGVLDQPLNHQEVIEVSARVYDHFKQLVLEILKQM